MNRKNFIEKTAWTLGGIALLPAISSKAEVKLFEIGNLFQADDVTWTINDAGHFSLSSPKIALTGCVPSFNNQPLSIKAVKVSRNKTGGIITYILQEGKLELTLSKENDACTIQTKLIGMSNAPHTVYPISSGKLEGAEKFYKQGLGFAGPSGLFEIKKGSPKPWEVIIKEDAWSYDSFMTVGLVAADDSTIAIGAYDHHNFVNRHTIYNRTHRRGLNDYGATSESAFMESGFLTENIAMPKEGLTLPTLHILAGKKSYDTLHQLATNIAKANNARTHQSPKYHFCSWLEYYEDYDAEKLNDLLDGLKTIQPPLKVQTIQIDGGYTFAGDWLDVDQSQYPGGLEPAFKNITDAGLKAGIWLAPFGVSNHSNVFKEHPEWILKDKTGNLLLHKKGKPFLDNKSTVEELYYLDTSHPAAMAHIKNVFATLKKWGVTYFKTDFMDWGLKDSTEVKRHTPGKTSAQYYTDLMTEIRKSIGEDSFWLGCIAPFGQMIGYVDGMRVSNDAGTEWAVGSTVNMLQESHATQYFNNVLWQNDPDILTFRDSTLVKITEEELFSLSVWSAISGGIITTSDRFHKLSKNRRNLFRFIEPHPQQKLTGTLPDWHKGRAQIVCIRKYENQAAWAIFVFNTTEASIQYTYAIGELIGTSNVYCFDWKPQLMSALGRKETLEGELRPHHSVLYYLSLKEEKPNQNLGLCGEVLVYE